MRSEWENLGIYTGAKEWLIQTRCATPAIYRNQRKPCAERARRRERTEKKLSLCFLSQVAARLVFGLAELLAHTKRHFVFLFIFLCMYYQGDLFGNDALGDDTV